MSATRTVINFIQYLYRRISEDNLIYVAAALTLTTLLAIVPVLSVFIHIINALPLAKNFDDQINQFIAGHLLPASDAAIRPYIKNFLQKDFSTQILIYLFIISLFALQTIDSAFNHIWRVKKHRRGLFSFIIYWSILILLPILIGLSLFLTSLVSSVTLFSVHSLLNNQFVIKAMIFCLEICALTILYYVIPQKKVPFVYALLGGISAMLILGISKFLFIGYMTYVPIYFDIYGAIAAFPLLIIWIFIIWLVILLIAEIINLMTFSSNIQKKQDLQCFVVAYLVIFWLWEANKKQKKMTLQDFFKKKVPIYEEKLQLVLSELEKSQWIEEKSGAIFVLKKDLSQYKLLDVYQSLPWKLPTFEQVPVQLPCLLHLGDIIKQIEIEKHQSLGFSLVDCFEK